MFLYKSDCETWILLLVNQQGMRWHIEKLVDIKWTEFVIVHCTTTISKISFPITCACCGCNWHGDFLYIEVLLVWLLVRLATYLSLHEPLCVDGSVRMGLHEWRCVNGFACMAMFEWQCVNSKRSVNGYVWMPIQCVFLYAWTAGCACMAMCVWLCVNSYVWMAMLEWLYVWMAICDWLCVVSNWFNPNIHERLFWCQKYIVWPTVFHWIPFVF